MLKELLKPYLKFMGERIVVDRLIRQHSICAGFIADMAIGIETARNYFLVAAYMVDHPETYDPPVSNFMLSRASVDGFLRLRAIV
jgi:hypothetical protein